MYLLFSRVVNYCPFRLKQWSFPISTEISPKCVYYCPSNYLLLPNGSAFYERRILSNVGTPEIFSQNLRHKKRVVYMFIIDGKNVRKLSSKFEHEDEFVLVESFNGST